MPQADAFQIVRDREGSPDDLREMGLRNLVQVNEEPKVFHTVYLAQPSACAGRAMSYYGAEKASSSSVENTPSLRLSDGA